MKSKGCGNPTDRGSFDLSSLSASDCFRRHRLAVRRRLEVCAVNRDDHLGFAAHQYLLRHLHRRTTRRLGRHAISQSAQTETFFKSHKKLLYMYALQHPILDLSAYYAPQFIPAADAPNMYHRSHVGPRSAAPAAPREWRESDKRPLHGCPPMPIKLSARLSLDLSIKRSTTMR